MSDPELSSWPRPYFQPGGGDAHLFYKIHGAFTGAPEISRSRYRCNGVPEGLRLDITTREAEPDRFQFGLEDGWIGNELRRENESLARQIAASPQCLVLSGVVTDPINLDYFRDVVGLVMALLDGGGSAVFDPHMFKWWSADEWRTRAFEPAGAVPRHHAVILVSGEPDGRTSWYHTRGMIKFGRPDLSVRGVTRELGPAVEDLCNRFIEMQAFGAVVPEGQEVKMKALPPGWRCRHGGTPVSATCIPPTESVWTSFTHEYAAFEMSIPPAI